MKRMTRLALESCLGAALLAFTMKTTAATWERLAPLPEPAAGFIVGAFDGNIVIAGGTNWRGETKHWIDLIQLYDPARNAWREVGRLPAPLAYAASGRTADGLCFAGGSSGPQTHGTLAVLDRQFAVKTIATIEPRFVYAGGTVLDGQLYVIGGAPAQERIDAMTHACFSFDLRTGHTTRLADLPVPGFIVGGTAACAGRVFVFGGAEPAAVAGEVNNLATTFAWSPAEKRWSKLAPYPCANRGLNAIALDERHIYIAGGYKNDVEGFTDEAFLFDVATETFRPSVPLPHRAMVHLVLTGEHLYCLGGEDRKKHRTGAVFRIAWRELLDPEKR